MPTETCEHCGEVKVRVGFDRHHGVQVYRCGCCAPVFTSAATLNEDTLRAALTEHGIARMVICGDQRTWMIAQRIVGLARPFEVSEFDTDERMRGVVIAPSELVRLDDSLGDGVWGLR